MEADISLSIEREPDFFALSAARGDGQTYVAEFDGHTVACASVCTREAYLLGEPGVMGYVGDIKVAPLFRRRGLSQRLLDEIAEHEKRNEPAPYVASAAAGNKATDAMIARFGHGCEVRSLGTVTSYQLLPLCRLRIKSPPEIGIAEERDEQELVEFLDAYYRSFSFAPVFRDGGLRRLLDRSPGMTLNNYRIARRRGRIVAALALWDETEMKRTRVRRMPEGLRLLSRALRIGRTALPLPPFPAEGEQLRFLYVRHPAYADGELQSLACLVRHALNHQSHRQLHFLLFTSADSDPMSACLRGIPNTKYHYALVAGTNAPGYAGQLAQYSNHPLFDDAALS
jgi:GNAT superfamily N-acetyltransferase